MQKQLNHPKKTKKLRAIYVVGNITIPKMYKSIIEELNDWDILAVNIDNWFHKFDIEQALNKEGITSITIRNYSKSEIKQLLENFQPAIVVVNNDDKSIVRIIVQIANNMSIPTLLVQDGVFDINHRESRNEVGITNTFKYIVKLPMKILEFLKKNHFSLFDKMKLILFELRYRNRWMRTGGGYYPGTGECLKIAVFGNASRELFISEGVASHRLVVTGNPKFDAYFHFKGEDYRQRVFARLGISSHKDMVLLLTQQNVESGIWSIRQRREFVIAISNAVATIPDVQLVIKLHAPQEKEEDYKKIIQNIYPQPIICGFESTDELINASSLAITTSSTTGLEAMAAGKPVIIADLFRGLGVSPFYQGSGAKFVTQKENLSPTIKSLLYDHQIRDEVIGSENNFVYQQAYLQDGQASRRIAELIGEMAIK